LNTENLILICVFSILGGISIIIGIYVFYNKVNILAALVITEINTTATLETSEVEIAEEAVISEVYTALETSEEVDNKCIHIEI
jgi:hypothetical protein